MSKPTHQILYKGEHFVYCWSMSEAEEVIACYPADAADLEIVSL